MAALRDAIQQLQALSPEDRKKAVAELNLAERIVVESASSPKPRKLRLFSGRTPVPSSEVDFDTWKLMVSQLVEDTTVSESDKKRAMLQNLLRPALDAIKSVQGTSKDILEVLVNIYGSVADGYDLLMRFHTSYQGEKESSSDYVQRIYLLLIDATKRGGAAIGDVPKLLLTQFIRGSGDENLILRLKLEEKLDNPPTFANLLLCIRKEESKALEKRLRMKASRVSAVVQDPSPMKLLQEKVAQLEVQLKQQQQHRSKVDRDSGLDSGSTNPSTPSQPSGNVSSGSVKGKKHPSRTRCKMFCYRCGQDGHCLDKCTEARNPALVQEKLESRWSGRQSDPKE